MYYIAIYNIHGGLIERQFLMRQPTESQIQTYWVESLNRYGCMIVLQNEPVKYADMGKVG